MPAHKFGFSGAVSAHGVKYRKRTCLACEAHARDACGLPERHARTDERGYVWCPNCRHSLHPVHFRRRPGRPHLYLAYCIVCTRTLDRARVCTPRGSAAWKRDIQQRVARKRRRSAREQAERRRFVADAIVLLGRRGFTRAEIGRLCDVSKGSLIDWANAVRRVTPHVAARFGKLLSLTAHMALGPTPVRGRRTPHPDMSALQAAMTPVLAMYPVRNAWVHGKHRGARAKQSPGATTAAVD